MKWEAANVKKRTRSDVERRDDSQAKSSVTVVEADLARRTRASRDKNDHVKNHASQAPDVLLSNTRIPARLSVYVYTLWSQLDGVARRCVLSTFRCVKRASSLRTPNGMLLFYLSVVLPLLVTAVAANNIEVQEIVEWVRSRGGYWNPKQEFRHDEEGLFGVFAAETIEEGEVLASLPWDVVIASPSHRFDNCDLVQLLAQEMNNDDSDFGPFIASLQETVRHHTNLLPAYWSLEGKALLNQVIDNGTLPPEDVFMENFEWKQKCDGVDKAATLVVMTHGENFGMAPLTLKYNSRGGSYTGAYFSLEEGDDVALEIRALRDLYVGEQIFTDYKDYGQIGTPELLRDYGFVEFYPQRYIFHEQEIAFDVDDTENGLQVTWQRELLDKEYPVPTNQAIGFLREQLERLQRIYPDIPSHKNVPKQELDMIGRFCRDMIAALGQAIVEDGECASGDTKVE